MAKRGFGSFVWLLVLFLPIIFFLLPGNAEAKNLREYSDTITNPNPSAYSNHSFQFTVLTDIEPGGTIDLTFPSDFLVSNASTTFNAKNIEVYDDGILRDADFTGGASTDTITLTSGYGGSIEYELNPSTGISSGSVIDILVGNHTSASESGYTTYSTSTGTTTVPADIVPIKNSSSTGLHLIDLQIDGGSDTANGEFHIMMIESVGISGDTTETVPPYRFNPTPTSTVAGTTLFVEIGLETDELAICKFDTVASTTYGAMPNTFDVTGQIVHSEVVPVTLGALNKYYVRCLDDEGNFNTDDFIIAFSANDQPSGQPNADGNVEGDGTGSGNDGTGDGQGGGGSTGGTEGNAATTGQTSGSGGSGGGSGGSKGEDDEDQTGGGFESRDNPYRSGDAQVIIKGYAYPGSDIYVLVDGAPAESGSANNDGYYSVTLEEIARGVYTFGVYSIDDDENKSSTFSTSFTVTGGRTSELSNINIAPSIDVDPDPVDVGQTLTISGYSIPDAEVTIENQKDGSSQSLKTFTTTSSGSGEWSITLDTNGFTDGTYKVRANAEQADGAKTNFSEYTFYGVGESANVPLNADLNQDGSVNLTDFSILLFWWGGDGGDSSPPADINQDGSVSLTDFSIMLFQWTG